MFSYIMYINPITSINNNFSYKGCLKTEFIPQKYQNQGISDWLVHESAFFRDLPILECVKNYLKILNKPISNIVSGACSEGFELLSIKMLSEDAGLKVNCLGFDVGERVLNKANSFDYTIAEAPEQFGLQKVAGYSDSFLVFTQKELMTPQQRRLKTLFDKYFITYQNGIYQPNMVSRTQSTEVTLRPEKRENVKFMQGNLLEMDTFLDTESVDVLFFKNAMYHLTYDENDMPKTRGELRNILDRAAFQIEKVVASRGLFVLGDLWRDNYLDVGVETYNALNAHGFEPVFNKSIWVKR